MLNGILTKIFLIPHFLRFQDNTNIKTKMKNKSAIQISNNKTKKVNPINYYNSRM